MIQEQQRFYIGSNCYIKPTSIVIRPEFTGGNRFKSKKQLINQKHLKNNKTKGKLSKKAISNLRDATNWLIHSAELKKIYNKATKTYSWFKINFITLTIPAQKITKISSKLFQKLFNTWLTYARKYFYLKSYVWKLEAHKSGNLHIHLTCDTFIHYKKLRDSWNRVLQKNELLNEYYSIHEHYNPNSTDVHSVSKINNLAGYMCKYLLKETKLAEDFNGRIWGCSQNLSSKNKCKTYLEAGYDDKELMQLTNSTIKWKAIETKPDSMGRVGRIGTIYFPELKDWLNVIPNKIKKEYNNFKKSIKDGHTKIPQEYLQMDFDYKKELNYSNEINSLANSNTIQQKKKKHK